MAGGGPDDDTSPSQARYWEELYERGRTGWEIGQAAPPLAHWCDRHDVSGQRALVVGCGRGHEARMVAEHGAAVVAVDFAPLALAEARQLTPPALLADGSGAPRAGTIDYRERDLFTLAAEPDRYDLVIEHCCFCAIEPERRGAYVDTMARVLFERGLLVGLFRSHARLGGPPYSIDRGELETRFAAHFDQLSLTVAPDSIHGRQGEELLGVFRRR
jgi:SAM-dependent methyltransferase